jgi:lysine-N-methylase
VTLRRPLLADHVRARRHSVDGKPKVILHDARSGAVSVVGEREWVLLGAADGTRDVDGILASAARDGVRASPEALGAFLEGLAAAGLVVEGHRFEPGAAAEDGRSEDDPRRPVEPLAGFSLACDGRGSCCRLYATVVFSATETARARGLLPDRLDAGACPARAFLPERGGVARGAFAVAQRDGRCSYLEDDGACALHASGGAGAKPLGCRTFPASFVDDGESIRVAPMVECACVLASAGRSDGVPLVGDGVRTRGDLPEGTWVMRVPRVVRAAPTAEWTRARFVQWSRDASARVGGGSDDAVAIAWQLAAEIDGGPARARAPAELRPWLVALASKAADRAIEDASWRSERDLARRCSGWIALTAAALAADEDAISGALRAPVDSAGEALYLRAILHGHQVVRGEGTVAHALRDRAVRLLVARAMPAVMAGDDDPACRHPLALVEAMLRGHGIADYTLDVTG